MGLDSSQAVMPVSLHLTAAMATLTGRGKARLAMSLYMDNGEMLGELPLVEGSVIWETLRRCSHVDRPVRRRGPVHEEDKMFGLHHVREMPMGALALSWSRLLDRAPPWLEAYGNFARELQGTDLCVVQVETLDMSRTSWLKWPRLGTLWGR